MSRAAEYEHSGHTIAEMGVYSKVSWKSKRASGYFNSLSRCRALRRTGGRSDHLRDILKPPRGATSSSKATLVELRGDSPKGEPRCFHCSDLGCNGLFHWFNFEMYAVTGDPVSKRDRAYALAAGAL